MHRSNAPEPATGTTAAVQLTRCPQCDGLAEIRQRAVLDSTAGPVEHVGVVCIARHTFLLPAALLAGGAA